MMTYLESLLFSIAPHFFKVFHLMVHTIYDDERKVTIIHGFTESLQQ